MATTTNYGWTTPDDTALVKDGASAIRTLGSSVDTTTKNLNPETTLGDISFRSSTSNVNTRLGIGGTGTVLTVAAGVPSWATPSSGSMTLLSTTTLTGASITISSISGAYKDLRIIMKLYEPSNNTGYGINMRFNSDSGTNYRSTDSSSSNDSYDLTSIPMSVNLSSTTVVSLADILIPDYANAVTRKMCYIKSHAANYFATTKVEFTKTVGLYNSTSAISALTFFPGTANMDGGTVLVYGVN